MVEVAGRDALEFTRHQLVRIALASLPAVIFMHAVVTLEPGTENDKDNSIRTNLRQCSRKVGHHNEMVPSNVDGRFSEHMNGITLLRILKKLHSYRLSPLGASRKGQSK